MTIMAQVYETASLGTLVLLTSAPRPLKVILAIGELREGSSGLAVEVR